MVDRLILGKHPDTLTVGLWISKAGANARTSTNPDDFLFSPSKYLARPYARVIAAQFTPIAFVRRLTYSDGSYEDLYSWSFTFAHGLGYVPLINITKPSYIDDPYFDAFSVTAWITSGSFGGTGKARYASNGSFIEYLNNSLYYYDPTTDKIIVKSTAPVGAIAVYRNRIV